MLLSPPPHNRARTAPRLRLAARTTDAVRSVSSDFRCLPLYLRMNSGTEDLPPQRILARLPLSSVGTSNNLFLVIFLI